MAETREYLIEQGATQLRYIVAKLEADFEKDRIRISQVGFVDPSKITKYFCSEGCHKVYDERPGVTVEIRALTDDRERVSLGYSCEHCKSIIFDAILPSAEGIPEEFIDMDETGKYKKPTRDTIDALLGKIEAEAAEGRGCDLDSPSYGHDISILDRWAEKARYVPDPDRIVQLAQTWRAAYLRNIEVRLPEIVKDIKKNAYGFSLNKVDSECTAFEGTGLSEQFNRLYEALPHIKLPEDKALLKEIAAILFAYQTMFVEKKDTLREQEQELLERIASIQQEIDGNSQAITDFLGRAGLTNSESEEARRRDLVGERLFGDDDKDDMPF